MSRPWLGTPPSPAPPRDMDRDDPLRPPREGGWGPRRGADLPPKEVPDTDAPTDSKNQVESESTSE
jgi:hypothetical protein